MAALTASEYKFVGEGNAHVVVRSNNFVLKLKKRQESFDRETQYISGVIDPLLSSSYRSLGVRRIVRLTRDFVCLLNEAMWAHRAESRRDVTAIDTSEYGMEEDDATRMIRWFPHNENLALEIKVKCGLKFSSPFYYNYCDNNDRLFKLKYSRFELKQIYKTIVSNDTSIPRRSAYNPCDLCSMNRDLIAKSLIDLYNCPQNNFKITSSSHGILYDGYGTNEKELKNHLSEYFGSFHVMEGFIPVVSNILATESILSEVQQLQGLDVLDIEGMTHVYAKLLSALGTQNAVLETISAYTLTITDILSIMKTNFSESQSTHVKLFLELKALQVKSGELKEFLASRHHQALQLLHTASIDDCLFLIHLYLLALTMKDASIIIAFAVTEQQDAPGSELLQPFRVRTTQSHRDGGVVSIRMKDLHYRITMCDIGPKPIKKIITKQTEEEEICKLVYNRVAL